MSLTENVEYEDVDAFAEKVQNIRESYFSGKQSEADTQLTEGVLTEEDEAEDIDDVMASYVETIRRAKS